MNNDTLLRAYGGQAHFYDLVFEPFYGPGHRRAIRAMDPQPGQRVLEVGAGTGLSLPYYPHDIQLTGIDLSPKMLAKAERRARRLGFSHVDYKIMDALKMDFGKAQFDHVVAMQLFSVVPDPQRLLSEMRRVCKPGGKIIFANYFGSDRLSARFWRQVLNPLKPVLGFRPLYRRARFLELAKELNWEFYEGKELGFTVAWAENR
jgi:phosphatidylethanolamine/phosphatidyl-N-methylethanolamine N-methyltransferase